MERGYQKPLPTSFRDGHDIEPSGLCTLIFRIDGTEPNHIPRRLDGVPEPGLLVVLNIRVSMPLTITAMLKNLDMR